MFQFQNGSINSLSAQPLGYDVELFQFQNGSINRGDFKGSLDFWTSFNSKMVRLIVVAVPVTSEIVTFQFQNGSINSDWRYYTDAVADQFQFQNGSINSHLYPFFRSSV